LILVVRVENWLCGLWNGIWNDFGRLLESSRFGLFRAGGFAEARFEEAHGGVR
jgi:hypothetical protein